MLVLAAAALAGCGEAAATSGGPSGTLYLAGREPGTLTVVDTATGAATTRTELRELGGGDPPNMVHFTGGRLVTFALGEATSFAADVSDARRLGEGMFFVASATPGRVWNILGRKSDRPTDRYFRGVREVRVDGTPTFTRRWQLPGWPVTAVDDGLVLQRDRLEVWDPRTERRVRRLPGAFLVATHGATVASCNDPCEFLYLNRRAVPGRFTPRLGAFSPDGALLALPTPGHRIAVVEVATGFTRHVTGARLDAQYPRLAWASSGWLFWSAGRGRLGAWRPGEPARRLPVRVGPFVDLTAS
ncbi:hypothetical protein DVA67_029770 [Solirubrobacter sp. CPCC 204708]|uniref:WD40 repeat domain-containing protein n=1 Tax=Solirubrobacter deserti TaxID=2282478 RepID=A0ABT4RUH6_9ACTN|nr:hypothetical protein [Solirubrobacter deserti]MBE2320192.1 hypothetical protein [Solirubrobacter deserti]MDA0142239.1 hypothetical protein [Solirubrobacter deserti]